MKSPLMIKMAGFFASRYARFDAGKDVVERRPAGPRDGAAKPADEKNPRHVGDFLHLAN